MSLIEFIWPLLQWWAAAGKTEEEKWACIFCTEEPLLRCLTGCARPLLSPKANSSNFKFCSFYTLFVSGGALNDCFHSVTGRRRYVRTMRMSRLAAQQIFL